MTVSRSGHSATLLPDGRVLIAGGVLNFGPPGSWPIPEGPGATSAEFYDPVSGKFTSTGSMSEGRSGQTETLLSNGTVLITGPDGAAELFNPGTGSFLAVDEPSTGVGATATLLNDGTVLVAGGRTAYGYASVPQLFAPECAGFVWTNPLNTARYLHTATRLLDGTVLVTGGTLQVPSCYARGCRKPPVTIVISSPELFK